MTQLYNITHNGGDLSEYDSTVLGGGDLTAAVAAALANSAYGLSCLINDTAAIYGQLEPTSFTYDDIRFRFYIDPNALTMASGDNFDIFRAINTAVGTQSRGTVRFRHNGSNYQFSVRWRDDADSYQNSSWFNVGDAPHFVEVWVERASSAIASDALFTVWGDGSQLEQVTGFDLFDTNTLDAFQFGAVIGLDAGTSGTLYLDELVINDDGGLIGAITYASNDGSLSFVGSPVKKVLLSLNSALSFVGNVIGKALKRLLLLASLGFSGNIIGKGMKFLSGAVGFAGVIIGKVKKVLTGSIDFAGSVVKKATHTIQGTLSFAGSIANKAIKILAGNISFVGITIRKTMKLIAGILSFAGSANALLLIVKPFALTLYERTNILVLEKRVNALILYVRTNILKIEDEHE